MKNQSYIEALRNHAKQVKAERTRLLDALDPRITTGTQDAIEWLKVATARHLEKIESMIAKEIGE